MKPSILRSESGVSDGRTFTIGRMEIFRPRITVETHTMLHLSFPRGPVYPIKDITAGLGGSGLHPTWGAWLQCGRPARASPPLRRAEWRRRRRLAAEAELLRHR